jgi:hypothetical protein
MAYRTKRGRKSLGDVLMGGIGRVVADHWETVPDLQIIDPLVNR